MILRLCFFVLLALLWAGRISAAPSGADSVLLVQSQSKRVGINSYISRNDAIGAFAIKDKHQFRYHLLNDHLYNTAATDNRFVKENYLAFISHQYRLRPDLHLTAVFNFDDNKANQTSIGSLSERLTYHYQQDSVAEAYFSAFAGIKRDARFGLADTGPEVGAEITAMLPRQRTESASVRLFYSRAQLDPRIFQRLIAEGVYEQAFSTFANLAVRAGYRTNVTEDYTSGNIQRIKSDTLAGQVLWMYKFSEKLALKSDNLILLPQRNFNYRPFAQDFVKRQDFRYEQFNLDLQQTITYTLPKLQSSLTFAYKDHTRTYDPDKPNRTEQDKIKDVTESNWAWHFQADYLLTTRHTLSAQTQAQLLRLDTPSNENNQDRDEVYYSGKVQVGSRWHGTFRTNFALVAEQRQFVYIKADQSAENYTDHNLRYEPSFIWAPGRFSWKADYQIRASYHVRALGSEQVKNRSSRHLFQTHELTWDFAPSWSMIGGYGHRENRLSLLNWERFKESPLDTTISYDLGLFVQKRLASEKAQSSIKAGYRFFDQRIRSRAGRSSTEGVNLIFLQNVTRQQGPELIYERKNEKGFSLSVSFWLQHLQTYYVYQQSDKLFTGLSYTDEELNRKSSRFYPYFDVTLAWQLRRLPF